MLVPRYDKLTDEQESAWTDAVAQASLLPAETGDGEGWLFHGTDQILSTWIMEEGFRDILSMMGSPGRGFAYFGCVGTAEDFAMMRMDADSPPAIIAVRTWDLLQAGMIPDPNYADGPGDVMDDWRTHVRNGMPVRIPLGGDRAPNVMLPSATRFGIPEVPLHPNSGRRRIERAQDQSRFPSPRTMGCHPDEHPSILNAAISPGHDMAARQWGPST